jgi:ribosome-associated translation inhibitor RaiA
MVIYNGNERISEDHDFIDSNLDTATNLQYPSAKLIFDQLQQIKNTIGSTGSFTTEIVTSLPSTGSANIMYLMLQSDSTTVYDKYLYINSKFEKVGNTDDNLNNYYTKSEVDSKTISDQQVIVSNNEFGTNITQALFNTKILNNLQDLKNNKVTLDQVYTKAQSDALLKQKVNSTDFYNKASMDLLLNKKVNISDFTLTKDSISTLTAQVKNITDGMDNKANTKYIYTKPEVDNLLTKRATVDEVLAVSNLVTQHTNQIGAILKDMDLKANSSQVYNKTEINAMYPTIAAMNTAITNAIGGKTVIVDALPEAGSNNVFYLLKSIDPQIPSELYAYDNNSWQKVGAFDIDTTNFVTKAELNTAVEDIIKTQVNFDNVYTKTQIDNLLKNKSDATHNHDDLYYTQTDIDTKLGTKADTSTVYDKIYIDTEFGKYSTTDAVNSLIANAITGKIEAKIVTTLPDTGESDKIYYVPASSTSTNNNYDIYAYVNSKWEQIDADRFNIEDYPTITAMNTAISNAISSKANQSTLDTLATKVDTNTTNISNRYTKSEINTMLGSYALKTDNISDSKILVTTENYGAGLTQNQFNTFVSSDMLAVKSTLTNKANSSDVYTKTQVDAMSLGGGGSVDLSNYSTKADTTQAISDAVATKANTSDVTTLASKIETNESNITTLQNTITAKANLTDIYNKTQIDTLLNAKAGTDSVTSLSTKLTNDEGTLITLQDTVSKKANSADVYTKTEMDSTISRYSTTEATNSLIANAITGKVEARIINTLPESGESNVIYYVPASSTSTNNNYDIYAYVNSKWEQIDADRFNIADYPTKTEMNTAITNAIATKADQSTTYTKTETDTAISTAISDKYTKTEVDNKIANIDLSSKANQTDLQTLIDRVTALETKYATIDNELTTLNDFITG